MEATVDTLLQGVATDDLAVVGHARAEEIGSPAHRLHTD